MFPASLPVPVNALTEKWCAQKPPSFLTFKKFPCSFPSNCHSLFLALCKNHYWSCRLVFQVCPKCLLQDFCPHLPSVCFSLLCLSPDLALGWSKIHICLLYTLSWISFSPVACLSYLWAPKLSLWNTMLYFPVRINDTQYILRTQTSPQTHHNLWVNLLNSAKTSQTCVVHFPTSPQVSLRPEQQQ